MKKFLLILLLVVILLVGVVAAVLIFNPCPPKGPWPMPPWCVEKTPFVYHDLDYISDDFETSDTSKKLELGIGTFDVWGNMHLFLNLGDDTRDHYEYTIERIGALNSDIYLITDVIQFGEGGTLISETNIRRTGGIISLSEEYLTEIGELTRSNGIEKYMYWLNISDNVDDIEDYLSRDMNGFERLAGELLKRKTSKTIGYESADILLDYTESDWDDMFNRWEDVLVEKAKMCEKAGVTHMIINPGDVGFNWRVDTAYQKEKYEDIAAELRKYYSGKIGIYGYLFEIPDLDADFLDFNVITLNGAGNYITPDEVESLKESFDEYFANEFWDQIDDDKEVYILASITSVENGVRVGFMASKEMYMEHSINNSAQAMGYEALFRSLYSQETKADGVIAYGYWWNDRLFPETKVLRNDAFHTIRSKDAENVFYKWKEIFN